MASNDANALKAKEHTAGKGAKWSDTLSTKRNGGYTAEKLAICDSRPTPRPRRRVHPFQRARAVFADATLLGTGSAAAAVIRRFDQSPIPPPSNVRSLIANNLPRLSTLIEHIYEEGAQTRVQIKEILFKNKSTKNIIVRVAPPSCLPGTPFDLSSQLSFSSWLDRLHVSKLLDDPPPWLFFAACTFFALAISVFQYRHGPDRYNARFLMIGGMVGVVLAALGTGDFVTEVKGYLAWSIIMVLLCSSLLHRILKLWPDPDGEDGR